MRTIYNKIVEFSSRGRALPVAGEATCDARSPQQN